MKIFNNVKEINDSRNKGGNHNRNKRFSHYSKRIMIKPFFFNYPEIRKRINSIYAIDFFLTKINDKIRANGTWPWCDLNSKRLINYFRECDKEKNYCLHCGNTLENGRLWAIKANHDLIIFPDVIDKDRQYPKNEQKGKIQIMSIDMKGYNEYWLIICHNCKKKKYDNDKNFSKFFEFAEVKINNRKDGLEQRVLSLKMIISRFFDIVNDMKKEYRYKGKDKKLFKQAVCEFFEKRILIHYRLYRYLDKETAIRWNECYKYYKNCKK